MKGIEVDNSRGGYILELEAKVRVLELQIVRLKKWIFDEIGKDPPENLLSENVEDFNGDYDQDQNVVNFIGLDSMYDNDDAFIDTDAQEFDLEKVKVESIDDDVEDHLQVLLEEQEQCENEKVELEPQQLENERNERYTFRKRKTNYSFADENEEDNNVDDYVPKPAKLLRTKSKDNFNTSESEFICPTCNRGFKKKYLLKSHEETHTVREKKYICHCSMAYLYACDLKKHFTRCSIGKKGPLPESLQRVVVKIPCTICEETFPNKYRLKRHLATTHADRPRDKKSTSSSKSKNVSNASSGSGNEDEDTNSKDYDSASDESNQDPDNSNKSKKVKSRLSEKNEEPLRYFCSTCNKAFFYKCKLKVHEKIHEIRERNHECPCGKAFLCDHDLKRHARDYCDVGKNYTFPPTERRKKAEGPFICHMCNREFNRNAKLKDHMLTHDPNRQRTALCPYCGKAFYEERHVKRHISQCHPEYSDDDPKPKPPDTDDQINQLCTLCGKMMSSMKQLYSHMKYHKSKNASIDQSFMCSICGASVKTAMTLKYHMNLHTREKTWRCSYPECSGSDKIYFHHQNLKLHILRIHNKNAPTFHCDIPGCNRKFKIKTALKFHIDDYHDKTEYECEFCQKTVISKYSLRRHIDKYHRQDRSGPDYPFKCKVPTCGQSFKEERWLNVHFDNVHGENRTKLTCPHGCKNVFLTKSTLRLHLKWKHQLAGVKPFVCEIDNCNKRFQVRNQLQQHQDTHVNKEERNYSCKYCESTFSSRTMLGGHIRKFHRDVRNLRLKCQFQGCGQTFSSTRYLEEHAETHNPNYDPLKFKCSICSKGYKISTERNRHEKIVHQNERPYKCFCGKDFKRLQHLQRHKAQTHEGKKETRKRKGQDTSSDFLNQHEPNY